MKLFKIFLVVLAIGWSIGVHEAGHLLAAKLCGIPVKSFDVGLPPTLFSFEKGGTEYRLNLLLIFGRVSITQEAKKAAPFGARFWLFLSGALGNFFCGWLLLLLGRIFSGKLNKQTLIEFLTFPVSLLTLLCQIVAGIVRGNLRMLRLVGPVGIGKGLFQALGEGGAKFLIYLFSTNIAVGIFQLFPMLPFDGGRILFLVLEMISSPLVETLELPATLLGTVILFFLLAKATLNDLCL